jgi:hypothetical protein
LNLAVLVANTEQTLDQLTARVQEISERAARHGSPKTTDAQ